MLNSVTYQGRLTAAPVLRYTQNQTPVASFSIAVQRDFLNSDGEREVDFFNCVAWHGTAEFVSKYFQKGSEIICKGRNQQRHYTDRNGNNREAIECVVSEVYFCGSKAAGSEEPPEEQEPMAAEGAELQPATFQEIQEEGDLPF